MCEKPGNGNKLKIIMIGAHPDDPETACGGTMFRLSQAGHEVVAVYITRGEAGIPGMSHEESAQIRTEEAKKACKVLNVRPEFLDQIDGDCEVNKDQYKAVYQFLEKEKPDIVMTHWPIDTHRDHRACSIMVYDSWLQSGKLFPLG